MEGKLAQLFETLLAAATPIGATVAVIMLGAWAIMRFTGWKGIGDKNTLVKDEQMSKLNTTVSHLDKTLGTLDRRIAAVETDLKNRPTSDDVHQIETMVARMDERQKSMDRMVGATNASVNRMEQFMIDYAKRPS
ncbi:MAG: hypothetical protein AAF317_00040 [Pseudomonadota bacterium]